MLDWLALWWPVIDHEWDGMQRHDGTLSQALATVARVDTRTGRVAFTVALAGGTVALWWHIVRWRFT